MNSTGNSDRAIAPTTILVLNRAPSCSLLRSVHRRSTVRVKMSRKTSRAAVIKLETAYRAIASRQLLGAKDTSSDPNVNTAESSRVRSAATMPNVQRCFGSSELIARPASSAAEGNEGGTHCSEDCLFGNTPFRCEQSGRGIHYTAARRSEGCVQKVGGFPRNCAPARPTHVSPAYAACKRPRRTLGVWPHRAK